MAQGALRCRRSPLISGLPQYNSLAMVSFSGGGGGGALSNPVGILAVVVVALVVITAWWLFSR